MCAKRGTTLWQKIPPPPRPFSPSSSPSLSLSHSPHLGLGLSTSHYPPPSIGLITPRSVLLLPPTAPSPSHNVSFIAPLTLLFIPVPIFTFLHLPPMTLGILSLQPGALSWYSTRPFNLLLLWHRLIDATRRQPLGHPSRHAQLDLTLVFEGIGLPPNDWWRRWSLHRGVLVDNMCQHHICGKVAQGAWIDAPECSLWLCRDRPAGHPDCVCGAHYTSQPGSLSKPQCGDKNREGCSDYP